MPLSLCKTLPVTAELLPRLLLSLEKRPQIRSSFPKNRSQSARSTAAAARFITISACRKSLCESHSRSLDEDATRIVGGRRSADNASTCVPRVAKRGQHPLLAHARGRGHGHLLSRPRAYFSTSDAPKQQYVDEEEEIQPHAPTGPSHDSENRKLLENASINPDSLHLLDPERRAIRRYFISLSVCIRKLGELQALGSIRISVSRPDASALVGSDNPDTYVGCQEQVYEWKAPTPGPPRTCTEKWEMQMYNGAVKKLKSLGFRVSASQSRSTGDADMEGKAKRQNDLAEGRISTDADTKTSVLEDEGTVESQDFAGHEQPGLDIRREAHMASLQKEELSRKANAEGQGIAGQEEPAGPRVEPEWAGLIRRLDRVETIGVKGHSSGPFQEEPTEFKSSAARRRIDNLSELFNGARTSRQMEQAETAKEHFSRPFQSGSPRPTIHPIPEVFSGVDFTEKSHQSSLPFYEYGKKDKDIEVVYVRNHRHADFELQRLFYPDIENRMSRIVGFDAEWRPNWRDDFPENAVSLVQLARGKRILLLQISAMRTFPKKLIEFLDDETFIKAGVNILADTQRLYRDYAVITRSCVELSYLARAVDRDRWPGDMRQLISLARLVQSYTGKLLSKGSVRTSNWESKLTESQQRYAANDAHAGLTVATSLLKRGNHLDRSLFMFDVVRANAVHADSQFWRTRSQASGFPAPAVRKSSPPPPSSRSRSLTARSEPLSPFHILNPEVMSRRGTKMKTNGADLISMLTGQMQRRANEKTI